jgi:DUF4097 and DUF4098 domain-containing protein YvlB
MNRTLKRIASFALLALLPAVLALAGDRHFEKKFSATSGGTLTLATDAGSLTVTGSSDNEVAVLADLRGRQKDVDDFDISASQTDKGVDVKGRGRSSKWFSWGSNDLEVHFTIRVPHEYNLKLQTSGGGIEISSLKGKAQGETSGGDIHLADFEGEVSLNTSGGTIKAENVKANTHMETSGGDIVVSSAVGSVDVSTSGGNIRISEVDGNVRAETSGGNITVKLKNGNKGVYAETSGGNVDIVMGKTLAANIDASTSGGDVVCDLPVTVSGKIDESRIKGVINGGGNTIYAHTSGGNVRIRALE